MVAEIDEQLEEFSEVNRIWCFMHIVNLVAKSLLKQFDTNKAGSDGNGDPSDAELTKLMDEFACNFKHEEWLTQQADTADEDQYLSSHIDAGEGRLSTSQSVNQLMGRHSALEVLLQGHQLDHSSLASMEAIHQ